jgi:hypothetical protein
MRLARSLACFVAQSTCKKGKNVEWMCDEEKPKLWRGRVLGGSGHVELVLAFAPPGFRIILHEAYLGAAGLNGRPDRLAWDAARTLPYAHGRSRSHRRQQIPLSRALPTRRLRSSSLQFRLTSRYLQLGRAHAFSPSDSAF